MNSPHQFSATITDIREIAPSWYLAGFSWPTNLAPPEAGQFFTFNPSLLPGAGKSLLRKPLAFAGFDEQRAYTIFQTRGEGTKAFARLDLGDTLDIIAPLGNCFPALEDNEKAFLAGGGIGLGPMLHLASVLIRKRRNFDIVLGFRTTAQIPDFSACIKTTSIAATFQKIMNSAYFATDDGSSGFQGTAIDLLEEKAFNSQRQNMLEPFAGFESELSKIHLLGCGPFPMLKALHDLAEKHRVNAHVSTEQWMACGVGACHGCVLPANGGGYVRVCSDGPVFKSNAIDWGECP